MYTVMLTLLQDAAPAAEAAATTGSVWSTILPIVLSVVGLAVTAFLIPLLRKQAAKASAEAEIAGIEKGAALFERVKGFVFRRVADLIEEEYPKIAAAVVAGDLNADTIKDTLYRIGANLKQEAIDYFNHQGIDVVKEMGDEALDKLIRSAANQLSPFPGKSTAVVLATTTISNLIVGKGVDWATKKFLDSDE